MRQHQRELANLRAWVLPAVAAAERVATATLEQELAALGITLAQFRVVGALLGETEGISQRALAARVGIEAPTLSVTITKLEAAGVVERVADPDDGRAWRVRIAGSSSLGDVMKIIRSVESRATRDIPLADLETTKRVLAQLKANLEEP